MTQPRSTLQTFTQYYFQAKLPRLSVSKLQQRAAQITTLIIDTSNLSSGELSFDRAIALGGSEDELLAAAKYALSGHSGALSDALSVTATHHAFSIAGRVLGATWHHGATFASAWIGKPTSIAHHADLTDSERERLLLQARQLAAHGSSVYAVAVAEHAAAPKSYGDVRAKVLGLLIFHPQIYHGTEETIAKIREEGIETIYASKDSEHVVQMFAAVSLLAPNNSVPFVYRPGREIPKDARLYASLTDKAHQKIVQQLTAESTLVVREPLPEFWKLFSTFL